MNDQQETGAAQETLNPHIELLNSEEMRDEARRLELNSLADGVNVVASGGRDTGTKHVRVELVYEVGGVLDERR